jgi:hypothetical protein
LTTANKFQGSEAAVKYIERIVISVAVIVILFCAHQYTDYLFKTHKWKGLDSYVWAAWIQAIGSIAAIFGAVLVMHWQHNKAVTREARSQRTELISALRSIRMEFFQYQNTVIERLKEKNQIWVPIKADFLIFGAHAAALGAVTDDTTLQNIMATRLQIENFFSNTNELSKTVDEIRFRGGNPDLWKKVDEIWAGMKGHEPTILQGMAWVFEGIDKAINKAIAELKLLDKNYIGH